MNDEQWMMDNKWWTMNDGQWMMNNEWLTMNNEWWTMNNEQRTKNNEQVYLWMFTWLTWACTRSTPSLIEVISVWYNVVIICKLEYYQRALSMITIFNII